MAQEFICTSTEPVVQTKEGKLRGFKLGSTYHFYGVKYAECKRWQQPLPVEPWDGIKDAFVLWLHYIPCFSRFSQRRLDGSPSFLA